MVDICPKCHERAVVPILNNKYRCKACGTYFDIVDLIKAKKKGQ